MTVNADQDAVIEGKVGTDPIAKEAYVQKVFDNITNDQIDAKYNKAFASTSLSTKKIWFDANPPEEV